MSTVVEAVRIGSTYQVMTLSAIGEAETPAGGSVCIRWEPLARKPEMYQIWDSKGLKYKEEALIRQDEHSLSLTLKSRINRRRAEVDMMSGSRVTGDGWYGEWGDEASLGFFSFVGAPTFVPLDFDFELSQRISEIFTCGSFQDLEKAIVLVVLL